MRVEVVRTERLFDGFFKLDRATLRHELSGGSMGPEIIRLNLERGDGAAALLVNRDTDCVVLTRQFRYAAWLRDDGGWILEIPAGTVPAGEQPGEAALRELIEEVGYEPSALRHLMTFYPTPGTTTERVHLYFAEVDKRHKESAGGGLDAEHEFIEVVELPVAQALSMLDGGEIRDGKTIVALQWLRLIQNESSSTISPP